jgi:ribonuclease P protein subunit POP4
MVGRILDETRNTFVLIQNDEKKTILKDGTLFQFRFPDGSIVEIDGKTIIGRPENRIKQRFRWRW